MMCQSNDMMKDRYIVRRQHMIDRFIETLREMVIYSTWLFVFENITKFVAMSKVQERRFALRTSQRIRGTER